MYPLTKSLDFPVTAPHVSSNEGWEDDYGDGWDDDGDILPAQNHFDDIQDAFGFLSPNSAKYGTLDMEEVGESEESDSDDDDNEPIEFDDMPVNPNSGNSRKQPNLPCCTTPFWFGDEDPQHVQRLMGHYEKVLGVDKERVKVKRGDVPFVGRVLRRQVLDAKGSDFLTIDAIDVYLNEQVPQGMPMTLLRHVHTLTRWDLSSGLPSESTLVSKRETRTHWKPLVRPGIRSWLFCLPHTLVKHSFTYSTSRVESPMRHSNDKPFSYQQFIPKRPDDDLDASFMPCGSPGSSPQRPPPKFHFG